ncbi:MAG: hypothetical protein V9F06_12415 [Thermomicrobiales bacterium]
MLAIEAKPLGARLTDKNAAQVVQYCAVEGIEWAALTNGRYLEFFNTFLKPDLRAKRVLNLDLLDFSTDSEFDELVEQLKRLSRESITTANARTWLEQLRLDQSLREIMLDPNAAPIKTLRKTLADRDISATPQAITQWFRTQLTGAAPTPDPPTTPIPIEPPSPDPPTPGKPESKPSQAHYGVSLKDLIDAGLLESGMRLVFTGRGRDLAHAELADDGYIVWNGERVPYPSDRRFAQLRGTSSVNGWTSWYVELPSGRRLLADVRQDYLNNQSRSRDQSPD